MKRNAIVAGAVLLVVLLFGAILLILPGKPPQEIAVRHVKSVQSAGVTTMTFEIQNHTGVPYIFFPSEVQVRDGNTWTRFQALDNVRMRPASTIGPRGLASYTADVTNLPANSIVRLVIRPQETLLGLKGFIRRAQLRLSKGGGGPPGGIPLNPYDKNSKVFGMPTQVTSEEFVEQAPVR